MPNGKPGDHPLTDILGHQMEVYGKEIDNLIRKIARLSSRRELHEWWESQIGWDIKPKDALEKAKVKLIELENRAKESGWETD